MSLTLLRPLAFIDLETTGTSVSKDRITEVAIVKLHTDGRRETFDSLVNPGIPVSDEIAELTGITNEMLAAAPTMSVVGPKVITMIDGCDIAGFGAEDFDVPLLWEELFRQGIQWDLRGVRVVDAMVIFRKMERRDLKAAVRFYLSREHEGAHRAMADVEATADVLAAQLERYPDLPRRVPELADAMSDSKRIDLAGRFVLNAQGVPVFAFGKHEGQPVASQMGYLKWMVGADFSQQTKIVAQDFLAEPFRQIKKAMA